METDGRLTPMRAMVVMWLLEDIVVMMICYSG